MVPRPSSRIKVLFSKSLGLLPTQHPQLSSPDTQGCALFLDGWYPMTDYCGSLKTPTFHHSSGQL